MLKQIQLLLSSFNKQPADYQFDINTWLQIIALYRLSDKTNQDYLVIELAKRFSITSNDLLKSLESVTPDNISQEAINLALESLHTAQRSAEDQKIIAFKQRAFKQIATLDTLDASRAEWLELIHRYEKRAFKRLTTSFILTHLSSIKKIDYDILVAALNKEQLSRSTKQSFTSPSRPVKRRRYHHGEVDSSENPLILASTPENGHLHSPLSKTGVRITKLSPATPERGYTNLSQTPGKHKVRPVYANGQGGFFKPLTPEKSMVDTSKATV